MTIAPSAAANSRGLPFSIRLRKAGIACAVRLALATAGSATMLAASTCAIADAPSLAQNWPVANCADDGPGSLRSVVASNTTHAGDTIDLTQLQCGTITLSTGQIDVFQTDLTFVGPGADVLTIDAGSSSRIFEQQAGHLSIANVTLSGGAFHSPGDARGGCVLGADIYLSNVLLTDCRISSESGSASGGAVFADTITLTHSRVTGNQATSDAGTAYGGGLAAAYGVHAKYSTISDNEAGSTLLGDGGAVFSGHYALIERSTIDHNTASFTSAIHAKDWVHVYASTISSNIAQHGPAIFGLAAAERHFARIYDSTIAFNHSQTAGDAAVYLDGQANGMIHLQSSIIAKNTSGSGNAASDLQVAAVLQGADNLVMTTNGQPTLLPGFITVVEDPVLGGLQYNGGLTRTHALLRGSPAIGLGNNASAQTTDQRGRGYPRTTDSMATVDIGAFQFDSIFADSLD